MLLLMSCVPGFEKEYTEIDISLKDSETTHLMSLIDRQEVDSLYPYLSSPNPSFAYLSARAFASIKEPAAIDSLVPLLNHKFSKVRSITAYALGQIGDIRAESYLLNAFKTEDTINTNNQLNANILEAIGKIGSEKMLQSIATISTYRSTDTLLLEGQTRGLYRFALRGMTHPIGTKQMVDYVLDPSYPESVRILAANYLARAKKIEIDNYSFLLLKYAATDPDPNIRLALVRALGASKDNHVHSYLLNQLTIEKDENVLVALIQSLAKYPYLHSIDKVINLLDSNNDKVARAAAQFIVENGVSTDAPIYKSLITEERSPEINAILHKANLTHLPHYFINTRKSALKDIKEKITATDNVYHKIGYIQALANEPNAYIDLKELAFDEEQKGISVACMESIQGLIKSPHFIKTFKGRHIFKRREIADILIEVFQDGDAGMMAVAADIISDPESKLKDILTETSYLIEARNKCVLPKEIETYNKIQEAIDFIKGVETTPKTLKYNNPIDWDVAATLSDSSTAIISTSKGNIGIEFFSTDSPGSVVNFIKLAESGFYKDKTFHRVVPNFVIQGGCPRGDGYGSLDYTIRSELGPLYYDQGGYIGMASAGRHTEGVQFFITHNPTPHLDGRYTIFGKVTSGLNVVQKIRVGDKITEIKIIR